MPSVSWFADIRQAQPRTWWLFCSEVQSSLPLTTLRSERSSLRVCQSDSGTVWSCLWISGCGEYIAWPCAPVPKQGASRHLGETAAPHGTLELKVSENVPASTASCQHACVSMSRFWTATRRKARAYPIQQEISVRRGIAR